MSEQPGLGWEPGDQFGTCLECDVALDCEGVCGNCGVAYDIWEDCYDDDEHDQFRDDVEADADALRSAGWGTDEDYGYYGEDNFDEYSNDWEGY